MDFTVFDTRKLDEYARQAKESWGDTPAYQEFQEKKKSWLEDEGQMAGRMMALFAELGRLKELEPSAPQVQGQVRRLQEFITEYFYTCTPEILGSLGKMYGGGGRFTESIDAAGGEGTGAFAAKAIEIFCENSGI